MIMILNTEDMPCLGKLKGNVDSRNVHSESETSIGCLNNLYLTLSLKT